ncbi:MAG: hypothetical protein BRD31_01205 [Bacteroidetes bacterium QH_2_64_26]|nr:MAG: hypothetical protein BRD31_01205 [Bacteroidetes bacterium QH_2_64_26]
MVVQEAFPFLLPPVIGTFGITVNRMFGGPTHRPPLLVCRLGNDGSVSDYLRLHRARLDLRHRLRAAVPCIRFDDDWPSIFLCSSPGHRNEVVRGPAARGIHGHAGGILYVIFWTVVVVLAVPSLSPWTVAGGVFIVTCGLEFLQLWSPARLEAIRDTFFGHALPGSTFGR